MPFPRRNPLTAPLRAIRALPRYPRRAPLPIDNPVTPLEQRVSAMRERNGVRLPTWGMMPTARSGYRSFPIRKRSEED